MHTVQQARTKEQLIFHVRRQGPRHQMCCHQITVNTVSQSILSTYIEREAGEVERGEESHAGGEQGGEDEVAAGPGHGGLKGNV